MIRWLRITVCVLCILASALLLALWVRSFEVADQLRGRLWGERSFVLASKEGRATAVAFRWTGAPGYLWRWEVASFPAEDEFTFPWNPAWVRTNRLGFGWNGEPSPSQRRSPVSDNSRDQTASVAWRASIRGLSGAGPIVPFWFLVLLTAAVAAAVGTKWPLRCSLRGLLVTVAIVAIVLALETQLGR